MTLTTVLKSIAPAALVVLAAPGLDAQDSEAAQLRRMATPTCVLAGLVATPPAGWINVPFASPPAGARGCQMLKYSERDQVLAVMRLRSASEPTAEFKAQGYDQLMSREIASLEAMGIVVDIKGGPLWTRDAVPVKGEGFRDARGVGLRARINGNEVAQEAHLLAFRSDTSKYLISLVTPAQSYDKGLYETNTEDMGVLMRSFQPSPR